MLFSFIFFSLFVGLVGFLIFAFSRHREVYFSDPADLNEFVTFHDEELKARYENRKIPIETLLEAFIENKVDIKGDDLLETLENRDRYVNYALTFNHFHFLLTRFVPEALIHSQKEDERMVTEHYDRGDDFFEWFLGPMMVYTSGYFNDKEGTEGLEKGQENKMNLVAEKLQLKANERHLDIGCGWGTFAVHAAKNFGTRSTGVTISKNQTAFGNLRAEKNGVADKAEIKCLDYRDIPKEKWDKISCLEMAEHVGVRNFHGFCTQVYDLLPEDGIFLMQVCGLRRAWQWRDIIWGLFMNKYIFPGADASTPLGFYVEKMEGAGFEIQSSENLSWHYTLTLRHWYFNWVKNKDAILEKYGKRWYRLWEFFLAWSVLIGREGTAQLYQIVATKNTCEVDRARFIGDNYVHLSTRKN